MSRRGFTLVETLVAMLLTSTLVLAVFGGLTFVGRGYRRDELAMGRAQVAGAVSEQLAEDLRHLAGSALPPDAALQTNGYEGTQKTFISEPRRGAHVVAHYAPNSTTRRGLTRLEYQEEAGPTGKGWAVLALRSHYLSAPPMDPAPLPWGATAAAYLVPLPNTADPDVVHLALAVDTGGVTEQVLWSFWRHRRGRFEAGAIMRHGREGLKSYGREAALFAKVSLGYEWVRLEGRTTAQQAVELRVELDLREPADLVLPFVDPQFRVHRVFAAGL